jgi:hypothetical protein
MDIRAEAERFMELAASPGSADMTPQAFAELMATGARLVAGFLTNQQVIAEALVKISEPPEMTVDSVDATEWAERERAEAKRQERHVAALERLAEALDGGAARYGLNDLVETLKSR